MLRIPALVVIIAVSLSESRSSRNGARNRAECELDGRRYAAGDTWHPVLPPFGAMPCVNCSCGQDGEVDCKSQTCPKPDCPHPRNVPDQCCPTCEVAKEEVAVTPDPRLGCHFHGNDYSDGDVFPSNSTALKPTSDSQCVLCVCTRGRVLCHLKSCPAVRCREGYINTSDDCCPKCKDCLGPDGVRLNGTSWTPVVTGFGLMKCIECKCLNGRIDCNRKQCPDEKKLRCKRPRKADGECCKSCRKGKKRRPNRTSGRNKRPTSSAPTLDRPISPTDLLTESVFSKLCPARRTDRLTYKIQTPSSISVAFDIISKTRVEVLRWTIQRGRLSDMRREQVLASEFRSRTKVGDVEGGTNKRHYKKFKRRLTRQFKRCEKKRSCRLKHLLKALKRLRLKKVNFSNNCRGKKN